MKNVTRVVLMVFLVCLCQLAGAIDLFWVGGTGNWNDPNNWSFTSGGPGGDGVPSSFDDVFFDANSFDAPGQAVTIDGDVFVRSMDWTGVTNDPQMIGTNAFTIFMDGSLTFSPDMFHLFEGSYQFESNDPGNTITSAGQVFFEEVTFNGNGEWTLVDNFGVVLAINIERGTFNSGGNDIITFTIFSDTELERTIDFGTSTIRLEELTGSNNPSQLILGGNNLNFSGADANVQVRGLNGRVLLNGPSNFEFGEIIFFTENSTLESQTSTPPTIGNLNFQLNGELIGDHIIDTWTLSMGQTVFISNGSRQLVDDIVTGDDCDGLANLIVRDNAGPTATIEFTFTPTFLEGLFLRGVEAQTPDGFAVPLFRSQDGGNNGDGWSFQSLDSRDLYWVGGSGDWNDRANWSESSGGPGGACIPKPNDNLFFDDNSFSSSNDVVSGIIPGFANNISYTSSIQATIDLPEIYINNNVDLLTLVNWNIENVYLVGNDEAGGSSNTDFKI